MYEKYRRKAMKIKFLTLATFTMSALFLCSCSNSVNTIENENQVMEPTFVPSRKVVSDSSTNKRLKTQRVDSQFLPTGLLKVQVTLTNTSKKPFKFSYRFIWFNKAGMLVNTPGSTWIEKDILGGDTAYLSSVGPNPQCADFKIKLMALE